MNLCRRHKLYASALIVLVSASMALFTLHSHHHFEWEKGQHQAQTGTYLSSNASVCPICGYLFGAQSQPVLSVADRFSACYMLQQVELRSVNPVFFIQLLGRSPPVIS